MERFDPVSTSVTLMPGVYDLQFRKAEWRFVKVDGGKTTTLRPAAVILAEGLKWKSARVTTQDGTEVCRFDAVRPGGRRCRRATTSSRSTATSSRSPPPRARCSR